MRLSSTSRERDIVAPPRVPRVICASSRTREAAAPSGLTA